jgi:hypothetical protein
MDIWQGAGGNAGAGGSAQPIKDVIAAQRARLRPWSEFFGKFSKPANVNEASKRITQNVSFSLHILASHGFLASMDRLVRFWWLISFQVQHFQANYIAVSALLLVYCM